MPNEIDLGSLGAGGVKIVGGSIYAQIGYSISGAGDVNGDGVEDFIFTGPLDVVNNHRGAAYVVFGSAAGVPSIDLNALDPTRGFSIYGSQRDDGFENGLEMVAAGAGDVNGDGLDDVIIGAPHNTQDAYSGGRAYIVYGTTAAVTNVDLGSMSATVGATISLSPLPGGSFGVGGHLGVSVAGVGDINGDGYDDVLVGADGDATGGDAAGRGFLLFGSSSGIGNVNLASMTAQQGFALAGGEAQGNAGHQVSGLGDINGDGFDDFAVAAPLENSDLGRAYVVFGRAGAFTPQSLTAATSAGGFVFAGTTGYLGWSISAAGDVNADGYDDIVLTDGAFADAGAYVVFGKAGGFGTVDPAALAPGQGIHIAKGAAHNGGLGFTVAGGGDVDGDGYDDVVIGVRGGDSDRGAAYVIFGAASMSDVALGDAGQLVVHAEGNLDRFGASLGLADLNRDGFSDLLASAPPSYASSYVPGAVYAIYGTAPTSAVTRTGTVASQTLAGGAGDDTLSGLGGDDALFGNDGDDVLEGGDGDDTLDGGPGVDTMRGGAGDDTYIVDVADFSGIPDDGEFVVENADEGTDTVRSSVYYVLGANLENLTLTGTADLAGAGNELDNIIIGNSGSNMLVGGAGADRMIGGAGADYYHVDNVGDVVIEAENEGVDQVSTEMSYVLGSNVEKLSLQGTAAIDGTGNELSNLITGNRAVNIIDGRAGADKMLGERGSDIYYVDNIGDEVIEFANQGDADQVFSSITYTLTENVENLELTGLAAIDGTGNALANHLVGNAASNLLDGGAGADTMTGGADDDTYVVDNVDDMIVEASDDGSDEVRASVNYTLGANLEKLTLVGTAITGTGNGLDNLITGNAAANMLVGGGGNDTLDGGAGADNMTGGTGDDIYIVDNHLDVISESAGEGIDTVWSSISLESQLAANVENLTLTGTAVSGSGNALANVITGNAAGNSLFGLGGADQMIGGAGDDFYVVDDVNDNVVELAGEGSDQVYASVSFQLSDNVEDLILIGAAISGTGNGLANYISGNELDNLLDGGAGADQMSGGSGNDTYVVDNVGDVIIEIITQGLGADQVNASIDYMLVGDVENLLLTGSAVLGTGNTQANVLTGNALANTLNGMGGADTMVGGAGDDVYVVDNLGDLAIEHANEGIDLVRASVSFTLGDNVENLTLTGMAAIDATGNGLANVLTGNAAANLLDGGAGSDTMAGGAGNDSYVVDSVDDVVVELPDEGFDVVSSAISIALAANVENLQLTGTASIGGTGNSLDNAMNGNDANNMLAGGDGNDVLDGRGGDDVLAGGDGMDLYYVDSVGDLVSEALNQGVDTVRSAVSYTLASNVENLVLTGNTALDATGNALNNMITGNSADNDIDGMAGADGMFGGAGNDSYAVEDEMDFVLELADQGTDSVISSVTYLLLTDVENLTLTGTSAINGTGNRLANIVIGNSAANVLDGGTGSDILTGGDGSDDFVFSVVPPGVSGVLAVGFGADIVTDFGAGDRIVLNGLALGSFAELQTHFVQSGSDTIITFRTLPTLDEHYTLNTITLRNVQASSLTASQFSFATSDRFGDPGSSVLVSDLAVGAGGWSSQDLHPRHMVRMDGDEYVDIVGFSDAGVMVSFGEGGGQFGAGHLILSDFGQANGWTSDDAFHRELADVSGDGRVDIVGFGAAGTLVAVARDGVGYRDVVLGVDNFGSNQGWTSQDGFARTVADVNRDGRADIIGFGQAGTWVALGDRDGNFTSASLAVADFGVEQGWVSDNSYHRAVADVNGDGYGDIVGFGQAGVLVSLSNGDGTFADAQFALNNFGMDQGWTTQDGFTRLVRDVNGDFRADIVGFGASTSWIAFGQADGTFTAATEDVANFTQAQGWASDEIYHREFADINNDFAVDIVGFGSAGILVGLNHGHFFFG